MREHIRTPEKYSLLDITWMRLVSQYGYDRAQNILNGRDPETNADLAKWLALGTRREGAA